MLLVGPAARGQAPYPGGREVMLFRPAGGGFVLDDRRLADSIRIFTHDVGRAGNGRLTVLYEGADGPGGEAKVVLYVLPPGDEAGGWARVQVEGPRDTNLYRALALKVRSVLAGAPVPHVAAPPPHAVPATSPSPAAGSLPDGAQAASKAAAAAVPVAVAMGAANGTAAPAGEVIARPPPASRLRFLFEGAAHLALSDGTALARAGGDFTFALGIGRLVELTAGFSVEQADQAQAPSGDAASATTWPLHLGARLVYTRGRFTFGGGARLGLALLFTQAASEERRTGDTRATGLAGLEALARVALFPHLSLFAALTSDVLLSRWLYTVHGEPALDTGRFHGAAAIGLAFTFP